MNKYDIPFDEAVIEKDTKRLINQLWKLIPMRENGENWEQHLYVIIEEISGLAEIYPDNVVGLILLSKLEGLVSEACNDFMLYRKTVFKCIDLVRKLFDE